LKLIHHDRPLEGGRGQAKAATTVADDKADTRGAGLFFFPNPIPIPDAAKPT
jgi:hypothetical protein